MKLYMVPLAPNPTKVMLYIAERAELNVDMNIEQIVVNTVKGRHKEPEHLARNPFGTVPALELDDGTYLVESLAIIQYLEQKFPDAVFTGAKFGNELSAHFAVSDVFVFPSKTDTFGLVVIEALASGLPVAAYPVSGPKDILAEAGNAGFVNEDLGRAIAQAYQGDKAAARAHAQKFTWDRCTDLFLDNLSVINAAA